MKHALQLPQPDTIVEPDAETFAAILKALEPFSEEDCDRIVTLQKYHETLYLFGQGIPRYRFVRGNPPQDMHA